MIIIMMLKGTSAAACGSKVRSSAPSLMSKIWCCLLQCTATDGNECFTGHRLYNHAESYQRDQQCLFIDFPTTGL
jgi:hypothetical protein